MTDQQAHIVLITADELRKDALSCYGNRVIQTPHLDRLASHGTRYNRAYANSPWCLPSRCSLATGLYPHNNRAYSNFRDCRLDPALPNIYNTLGNAGYQVAHIGKCHYTPVPYSETRPDQTLPYDKFREYYVSLGIDHLALQDDKQVSVWFYDDYSQELDAAGYLEAYRDATWDRSNQKVFEFPGPAEWHPDSWVGRKAVEYVESYDADQPTFMWISFSGPHFPMDAPADYFERVDLSIVNERVFDPTEFDDPSRIHHDSYHSGSGGRIEGKGQAPDQACKNYPESYWHDLRRNYFANVALIDDQIGRILDALQTRFGDNVLVIFTADHGEMLGNHGLWGKNNCAYEDVLNVPLLMKYPDVVHADVTDELVMLVDVLPTCLQAARVENVVTDGVPLPDRRATSGADFVLAEGEGFLSISDGTTKFNRVNNMGDYTELIDLANDPHEFKNCINDPAYTQQLTRLQGYLVDIMLDYALP